MEHTSFCQLCSVFSLVRSTPPCWTVSVTQVHVWKVFLFVFCSETAESDAAQLQAQLKAILTQVKVNGWMLDNYIVLSSISPSSYHYSFGVGVGWGRGREGGVVPGWCDMIVLFLQNHASAWPFQRPVEMTEAPDYYDHIKYPMGELLFFPLLSFSAFSSIENIIQFVWRGWENGTNELKGKGERNKWIERERDKGRGRRSRERKEENNRTKGWSEGGEKEGKTKISEGGRVTVV